MKSRMLLPVLIALALLAGACSGSESDSSVASGEVEAAEVVEAVEPDPTATEEPEPEPTALPEPTAAPEPTEVPEPTATPEPEEAPAEETTTIGASGCGAGAVPGTTTETFEFEGRDRVYEQVVPTGYDDAQALPVVLNWHGLGSNGPDQVGFSDYATLANSEGFIVIAPTGVPSPGEDRNSWELIPEQDPTRDDLAFANTLLDLVIGTLCVDDSRVYTTGMSNGGYFSSVLVCEMSERIAAAASVAALSHSDDCDPSRVVPYIGFHGTDDDVVPYDGSGESSLAPGEIVPLFELKILDEFTEFAVASGCQAEAEAIDFSENVTAYEFAACEFGAPMTFYEIEGAGHTWPGSVASLALSEVLGLGVTTDEISASQTSWEFFKQHSLPQS